MSDSESTTTDHVWIMRVKTSFYNEKYQKTLVARTKEDVIEKWHNSSRDDLVKIILYYTELNIYSDLYEECCKEDILKVLNSVESDDFIESNEAYEDLEYQLYDSDVKFYLTMHYI